MVMLEIKPGPDKNPVMKHITETEKWERASRVETIGEMLVRLQAIKLSELMDLVSEWEANPEVPLGEIAVERGLISKESLFQYLDAQSQSSKVIDESLRELGHMTNEEKWHKLLQSSQSLGEILLKKKKLKLAQLIQAIEEQKNNPGKSLEEILLEKSILTKNEIREAMEYNIEQQSVTINTVREIKNFST
jgi:hypothetical protein